MPSRRQFCHLALSAALIPALPLRARAQDRAFGPADVEWAEYAGTDLPPGRSALTAKVQILLGRSGTSPGVVDGFKGGMSDSAIRAFQRRAGLRQTGVLDQAVWNRLQHYTATPLTQTHAITQSDLDGLVDAIPTDYAEKAAMSHMGYTSLAEKLGETYQMDERFLVHLNPGVPLAPGATIHVANPGKRFAAR